VTRSIPEWRGATPDSPVPDRVKVRVFARYDGYCHWTGKKIMPGDVWDADHIIALINGGLNIESNLAPILRGKAHAEKTARDVAIKSKTARMRKRHLGLKKPRTIRSWRKMDGTPVYAGRDR
jgi:hypothetical protein